jgi:mRNA-degrading endonuclease RelE of RelBE toxin-antitoxin system
MSIVDELQKKLKKLSKKDKYLYQNFNKKVIEIISRNITTIDFYKNLKSPKNQYKRIHLTDNYILLFSVDKNNNHIIFEDIQHRDYAYENK